MVTHFLFHLIRILMADLSSWNWSIYAQWGYTLQNGNQIPNCVDHSGYELNQMITELHYTNIPRYLHLNFRNCWKNNVSMMIFCFYDTILNYYSWYFGCVCICWEDNKGVEFWFILFSLWHSSWICGGFGHSNNTMHRTNVRTICVNCPEGGWKGDCNMWSLCVCLPRYRINISWNYKTPCNGLVPRGNATLPEPVFSLWHSSVTLHVAKSIIFFI